MSQFIRKIVSNIHEYLDDFPVSAIIGARQVGKSTLAKQIVKEYDHSIYLDLERPTHLSMIAEDAEKFLLLNNHKLICLDEIQLLPNLFPLIRSLVDDENYHSKFLVLGSASPELLRQTAESLAGRIIYFHLTPFLFTEIKEKVKFKDYRLRGGFPKAILAKNDKTAFLWYENFISTFLERDLRTFGFDLPPETMRRLWRMLAHLNGQMLNSSKIGNSMGQSHTTIKKYIDILKNTFMIRLLEPYHINVKKRLVKSPKIYLRDVGILHSLLGIYSFNELYAHPVYGSSWEVVVIENIIGHFEGWESFFYRTSNGNEIDLVLTKADQRIAIEIKASTIPKVSKGFYYALEDIKATKAFVIGDVEMPYPLKDGVMVYNLNDFLELGLQKTNKT